MNIRPRPLVLIALLVGCAIVGALLFVADVITDRACRSEVIPAGLVDHAEPPHGPDGSGATGRVGDELQWEIYAERSELGRAPVTVWVHGNGWSVRCSIHPPGSVPPTGCVTMMEPRVSGGSTP